NILIWTLSCRIILHTQSVVMKRSPMELGYVTFPKEIEKHTGHVIPNKTNTEMDMEKNSIVLSLPASTNKISHRREWIPGQIRDHSFIPAHIHHIFVPVVITRTVIVKPTENFYDYIPRTIGGYGAGSYTGGQGAGHGFQIGLGLLPHN
ncbi:hypothetical protein NQ318_006213, partial [Aromia moschata]